MHVNPRWDDGNVVERNTYEKGGWQSAERGGPTLPLQKNAHFQCKITGFIDKFEVYIAYLMRIAIAP